MKLTDDVMPATLAPAMLAPNHQRQQVTVIEPARAWVPLDLAEIWQYRELLFFLTWRDIKVRYKQTSIGVAWAVIQPLFTMLIFTLVFGHAARLPSGGIPYSLFTLVALLPWTYCAYVLTQSGESLVANANMVTKVYFPRLALPLSSALAGLVDSVITGLVLIGMMIFYGVHPGVQVLFLPFFVVLAIAAPLSVGIWLSALNVQYRDVRYALPFLTQAWLYASPVAYSSSLVKGWPSVVYALNPLSGVIDGFRWTLLGTGPAPDWRLLVSVLTIIVLLVSALFYFRRLEQTFADVV